MASRKPAPLPPNIVAPPTPKPAGAPKVKEAAPANGAKKAPGKSLGASIEGNDKLERLKLFCASSEWAPDLLPNDFVEPQFPTDSIVLDWVLGFDGGIHHHGRMIQFQGQEHTGKTTLALHIAGAFQRHYGEAVAFMDYEHSIGIPYAFACGMIPGLTKIYQPRSVRKSIKMVMDMMENDLCRCFVFDSISCMVPDTDLNLFLAGSREMDQHQVGEHARFMLEILRLLNQVAARKNALLLFVNQATTKIETNVRAQQAAKYAGGVTNLDYDTKGGRAPKQFASYQIETSKGKAVVGSGMSEKSNDEFLYENAKVFDGDSFTSKNILRNHIRILKNKVTGGGYREADIYLRPGGGIDDWISVRELAKHYGLIARKGNAYRVGTDDNVLALYGNKAEAIKALVYEQDMSVLVPLRALLVDRLRADGDSFRFKPSVKDLLLAGEEGDEFLDAGAAVTEDFLLEAQDI